MWRNIERGISEALAEPFRVLAARPVGGGCINEAVHLEGEHRAFFVKLNRAERLDMFEAEAAGLAAIRASDSLRAPQPVAFGRDGARSWLALEFLALRRGTAAAAARLGRDLATMHRSQAGAFGWDRDNTIGTTPQPNTWSTRWSDFLGRQRLGYQLQLAAANGLADGIQEQGRRLLARLPDFFRHYDPAPSLLHGDLWGGNWGVDEAGNPVVFDPAVHYGDREADIAMTELFGGFGDAFYRAYRDAWPLDSGYESRRPLYQLYHVLNHFNLFGGGYAEQAGALIEHALATPC